MAISEDVVAKFKADTSGLEAGAKRASGAMDGLGRSAQNAAKQGSAGIDGLTAGLLKFNLAVGTVEKGIALFGKALDFAKFSEDVDKLRKVVSEGLVESIRTATSGVVSQMDIMKVATKALTGDLKFTETQITTVFKAAKNLSDRGFGDTAENAEKMFKALRKGTTEELKEFGIVVNAGKSKSEAFANSLAAVDRTASDLAGSLGAASSETARFAAQSADLGAVLKETIGESLRYIINLIAQTMEGLDDLTNNTTGAKGFSNSRESLRAAEGIAKRFNAGNKSGTVIDSGDVISMASRPGMGVLPSGAMVSTAQEKLILQEYEKEVAKQRGDTPGGQATPEQLAAIGAGDKGKAPGSRDTSYDRYRPGMYGPSARTYSTTDDLVGPPMGFSSPGSGNFGGSSMFEQGTAMGNLRAQSSRPSEVADLFPGAGKGGFGSGFTAGMNPREEMMGLRDIGVETAGITQAATTAAIEAAVTGQGSIVKAAKAAIATQLMTKAISWGFEGAAMLFTGNPQGAGMIALATAAAVAARSMGAGGGGPAMPSGAGGRPGGGYVGGAAARPGGNVTIVVSGGNGAANAVAIDNALRAAKRSGLIPDSDGPGRITS